MKGISRANVCVSWWLQHVKLIPQLSYLLNRSKPHKALKIDFDISSYSSSFYVFCASCAMVKIPCIKTSKAIIKCLQLPEVIPQFICSSHPRQRKYFQVSKESHWKFQYTQTDRQTFPLTSIFDQIHFVLQFQIENVVFNETFRIKSFLLWPSLVSLRHNWCRLTLNQFLFLCFKSIKPFHR